MNNSLFVNYMNIFQKGAKPMSFSINRINPNQTQILFIDGRFETLTNEELDVFLYEMGMGENATSETQITD